MEAQALDVRGMEGSYIAEIGEGKVVAAPNAENLEAKLREMGFDDESMPALESVPPAGLNLF
jgi:Fe2+ transport system protein FeoA